MYRKNYCHRHHRGHGATSPSCQAQPILFVTSESFKYLLLLKLYILSPPSFFNIYQSTLECCLATASKDNRLQHSQTHFRVCGGSLTRTRRTVFNNNNLCFCTITTRKTLSVLKITYHGDWYVIIIGCVLLSDFAQNRLSYLPLHSIVYRPYGSRPQTPLIFLCRPGIL